MITPSIEELTKDHFYNRYTLVAATAKCARIVTSEYVEQREYAERQIETKATDKSHRSMITDSFWRRIRLLRKPRPL